MTTLGTMRTRILDDMTNESITSSQVDAAILTAVKHYERKPFYFNQDIDTFSTVAAQEYYTSTDLAAIPNIVEVKSMLIDGVRARQVDFSVVEDEQDGTVTGTPYSFALWQQQIRLYPIPTSTLTVKMAFIYRPTTMSAGTDSTVWTTDAEELIRQSAKRRLCLDIIHDDGMAGRCAILEKEALDELMAETRRRIGNMTLGTDVPRFNNGFNIDRGW